jgi:hypothetical protein
VRGVVEHQARIDELLATYAEGWTLERMPAVDRNVLRLGVFEVLFADDVPDAVALTEAMSLVRDLSTDESPQFVNGVLGNIVRNKAACSHSGPDRRFNVCATGEIAGMGEMSGLTNRAERSGREANDSDWLDYAIRAGLVAYGHRAPDDRLAGRPAGPR